MKKVLFTSLFLLMAATTNAADWVKLGSDKARHFYVDADRIQYENKTLNYRSTWVKAEHYRPEDNYKIGEYTIAKQIFDCDNTLFNINTIYGYKKNGDLIDQERLNTGWMEAPSGSVMEYITNSVCAYPHI
ncbi:surface-adhesin E family protein [Acinetobacter proteolyticus]|uniref:Surface-adhesin protein E-like domain-containing protein n=1 Tax=Acinetobacter proteolyticus TaxID=1776741 RepID=A0A2N0WIE4_9GAMM|nr:surface-adhesin E family protein [Acinetobacter proteolyticus]PKF35536.1 hypothetical protein CW311_04400 [Acinetobacter proteolyticus]